MLEYSLTRTAGAAAVDGARRGEERKLSRMSERDRSAAMDAWGADGDSVGAGTRTPISTRGTTRVFRIPSRRARRATCPA